MKIVKKPWGKELWFAHTDKYVGKLLFLKKGNRLSLQYHKKKDETLYALKGDYLLEIYPLKSRRARATKSLFHRVNGKKRKMKQGSVIHFPPKTVHRMEAKYGDVVLIEVSTPEVEDVVRIEDDYKRVTRQGI